MPLAYFVTFTTYGTWLHGDDRGSVDREHHAYATPLVDSNPEREEYISHQLSEAPFLLNESSRTVVCDALVGLCDEKGWILHAAHVRSNHVHLVISAERNPARLVSDLKARATRELHLRGMVDPNRRRVWTRHASTGYIFDETSLIGTMDYVLNQQGPRMACYAVHEATLQVSKPYSGPER